MHILIHLQDRRWNADKPSAALDPYIPTWLTTSSANHRPTNFWKSFFFFFFLKHWKEIVISGAISCWTDVDQFQIWSSHSLILEVQIIIDIIYQSIMRMLIYFHSMSLRCSYMIFSVAYLYRLLRGLMLSAIPRYIQRCVVGSLHISGISSQRAHDAIITSLWRQNDVATSFWRHNDVICTSCVHWGNDTGWAIMEELSIRRRVRTFLISWGQKTLV